jgi:hypothetical protein
MGHITLAAEPGCRAAGTTNRILYNILEKLKVKNIREEEKKRERASSYTY